MSVTIPIQNTDPFFDLQASLDDVTYTLQFRWNVRLSAWFMDVLDEQGENILQAGLRLVVNWPIGARVPGHEPPGFFLAADTSDPTIGGGTDPGLGDLGDRVQLVYYTLADIS